MFQCAYHYCSEISNVHILNLVVMLVTFVIAVAKYIVKAAQGSQSLFWLIFEGIIHCVREGMMAEAFGGCYIASSAKKRGEFWCSVHF